MPGFDDNWSTREVAGHPCDIYRPTNPSEHGYVVIYLHGVHEEPLKGKDPFIEQFENHGLTVVAPRCGPTWWADRLTPHFDEKITPQGYVRQQVVEFIVEHTRYTPAYEEYRRYEEETGDDGYPMVVVDDRDLDAVQ